MPRNSIRNTQASNQTLEKIRKLAHRAANEGRLCPAKVELKNKRGYDDVQAETYILAYEEKAGTPTELAIRRAHRAARDAVAHGRQCPSEAYLRKKMRYTDAQVAAYLAKHRELEGNAEAQAEKKARKSGQGAASLGKPCPSAQELRAKGYTAKQIEAYLAAFTKTKGTEEKQVLRKVLNEARVLAYRGYACPSAEALQNRGFSAADILAYQEAYMASKGTDEEQALRKARYEAQTQASKGYDCLTAEVLQSKGYSLSQIEAYLQAYQITYDKKQQSSTSSSQLDSAREDVAEIAEFSQNSLVKNPEKPFAESSDTSFTGDFSHMEMEADEEEAIFLLFSSFKKNLHVTPLTGETEELGTKEQSCQPKTFTLYR